MVVTFTGAFATNNSVTDMVALLVLGVFAYFVAKFGYSMAPLAVGIVLGSTIETGLTQGMIICHGSVWEMLTRPLSGTILWLALILLAATVFKPVRKLLSNSKED